MEVYAAMVDRMDQGVGKIVAELKRTGRLDDTLIFFLQDNGGCAEPIGRGPTKNRLDGPRPERPTLAPLAAEALPAALMSPQTRDGFPVRQGPNVFPGPADTYVAYGRGWANVSNTPFREYKHWVLLFGLLNCHPEIRSSAACQLLQVSRIMAPAARNRRDPAANNLIGAAQAINSAEALVFARLAAQFGPSTTYTHEVLYKNGFADPSAVALGCQARPLLNFR